MSLLSSIQWARAQDLQRTAKAVLMAVATRSNDGRTFASTRLIADEAGVSPRCASMTLGFLELNGFIRRQPRYRRDGSRDSDLVTLAVDRAAGLPVVYCREPGKSPLNVAGLRPAPEPSTGAGEDSPSERDSPSESQRRRRESHAEIVHSDSPLTSFEASRKSQEETPIGPQGGLHAQASPKSEKAEGSEPPDLATFDALMGAFPRDGRAWADPDAVRRAWAELSPDERRQAAAAAPEYARFCEAKRQTPYKLQRWLRRRIFANHSPPTAPPAIGATAATVAAGASPPTRVFVVAETPAWDAWQRHLRANGQRGTSRTRSDIFHAEGWYFPSEWPPDARGQGGSAARTGAAVAAAPSG